MNYDSKVIGKKLLTERKKRGWTRAKLSELTNISEKQIYKYEKGKVFPSIESLQLLCNEKIYNCELGYRVHGSPVAVRQKGGPYVDIKRIKESSKSGRYDKESPF